jgi:hypothetical protein
MYECCMNILTFVVRTAFSLATAAKRHATDLSII